MKKNQTQTERPRFWTDPYVSRKTGARPAPPNREESEQAPFEMAEPTASSKLRRLKPEVSFDKTSLALGIGWNEGRWTWKGPYLWMYIGPYKLVWR